MASKHWYQTGYEQARKGLPPEAPVHVSDSAVKRYMEGYGDRKDEQNTFGKDGLDRLRAKFVR